MEYSQENPDEERYEPKHNPFTIRFFNISCTLKDKTKRVLLDQISGEIRPFCMTAVVGPSGCGKTTLINTLCGKAYYADVEGHILINGKDEPVWKYKNTIGFVSQEDTMHRELTVREVLMYQAQLRLPSHLSKRQKNARVNRAIRMLKLTDVADAPIGDQETSRGISGGERKRVSIGMELVADTQVLILDEPTSGLDSSSSLTIARILKSIAERGITVCVILHQPRYEIFEMFDHILLLGSGGRLIYQGSPTAAVDYFKHIGFPPPVYRNPADFYIDVVSGDVVKENWDPSTLPELWEEYRQQQLVISNDDHDVNDWEISFSSNDNTSAHASSKFELPPLNDDTFRLEGASQRELDKLINFCYSIPSSTAECLRQFWIFLSRTALCQTRIWSTLLLDQFTILVTGFVVGFLFCEVPLVKYLAFVTTSGLSIGLLVLVSSLRCFGHQRLIYWRESSVGVNKLSFFLAVNIAQFPILIISPLTYWSSCYTLAAPRSSFNSYYIVFLAVVFAISGSGYLMSIIFNPRNSQIVSIVLLLIATMCSGSQKRLCYMDGFPVLGPLSYKASFSKYMCQALYETEVTEFPDVLRGVPEYIAQQNHYTLVDEFWWCTGIIVLMGVIARVLAFVALVFTNRGKQV